MRSRTLYFDLVQNFSMIKKYLTVTVMKTKEIGWNERNSFLIKAFIECVNIFSNFNF